MVTASQFMEGFINAVMTVRRVTGLQVDLESTLLFLGVVHFLVALALLAWRNQNLFHGVLGLILPRYVNRVSRSARGVVCYVREHSEANNADLSLSKVNDYVVAHPGDFVIHVGPEKGALLDKLIARADPTVVLEMGAYFGYSAVRMARLLKQPNAKVYSMEINPECADISREFVQFCGMAKRVEVFTCSAAEGIAQLRDRTGVERVDFVFVDHWKPLYMEDLQKLEASGLMHEGTVVVADNIVYPGAPAYRAYVTGNPDYATSMHPFRLGDFENTSQSGIVKHDAVAVSVYQGKSSSRPSGKGDKSPSAKGDMSPSGKGDKAPSGKEDKSPTGKGKSGSKKNR